MIIGLIEGDFIQQQLIKTNLMHHTIFSSELARLETRLLAIRTHNQITLEQLDKFFMACEIISLNRAVFEHATYLRANTYLKTPDALHLAAAIQANCDEFWTNDKQLIHVAHQYLKAIDLTMLIN